MMRPDEDLQRPTVVERMEARSAAHLAQIDQKARPPSIVVHVWPNVLAQQYESDHRPPRRRDYIVPTGSCITVVHGSLRIDKPDGSSFTVDHVSRVEVATSV